MVQLLDQIAAELRTEVVVVPFDLEETDTARRTNARTHGARCHSLPSPFLLGQAWLALPLPQAAALSSAQIADRCRQALAAYGHIDVLINNAGNPTVPRAHTTWQARAHGHRVRAIWPHIRRTTAPHLAHTCRCALPTVPTAHRITSFPGG